MKTPEMIVEFLGHAGFLLRVSDLQILIDPWLTPSTLEEPVLSSFVPSHRTIDFLVPEPIRRKEEISPDIVLLSHYHSHHSPKGDLEYWLSKSDKPVTVIGFDLHPTFRDVVFNEFSLRFPRHKFITSVFDSSYSFGQVSIEALTHTSDFHFAFFVKFGEVSFLHLADAKINRRSFDRRLDPVWHKFSKLKPTFFALTVGTTSLRFFEPSDRSPMILENASLSPVEAANLTAIIEPKLVSVMGIFNFSIWKNREEFSFSALENESYFRWAIQHLNNNIAVVEIRPGMNFFLNSDETQSFNIYP